MFNQIKIIPYSSNCELLWDEYISQCPMTTFLHSRRYLSYHADRFQDISLLIKDEQDKLLGVFLAALNPHNPQEIVSHSAITYGGLLHRGNLKGEKMLQIWEYIKIFYQEKGFNSLIYKAIPYIYQQSPNFDDIYALFRLNANRYRCDLSSAIDLKYRLKPSQRRQRGIKKAKKSGILVKEGVEFASAFWEVLTDNLSRKHDVKPVHTIEEIKLLYSLFPNNIKFIVGIINNNVIAGTVLFCTETAFHAQYIGSSEVGYQVSALDAIFDYCIDKAYKCQKRYFSFGVSTVNQGKTLNSGLHEFKTSFGGGGILHEFYRLKLN